MSASKEECIQIARKRLLIYLKNVKDAIAKYGFLNYHTEEEIDAGIELTPWDIEKDHDKDLIDDWIDVIDQAIDGYLIKPRQPYDTLSNCWAVVYIGQDVWLVWHDDKGYHGVISPDGFVMSHLEEEVSNIDLWMAKYGCWPIREGYLLSPSSNVLIYEIGKDYFQ